MSNLLQRMIRKNKRFEQRQMQNNQKLFAKIQFPLFPYGTRVEPERVAFWQIGSELFPIGKYTAEKGKPNTVPYGAILTHRQVWTEVKTGGIESAAV